MSNELAMQRKLAFAASIIMLSFACVSVIPAQASKETVDLKQSALGEPATSGLVDIGHLPADTDQLSILAENAQVKVIHSDDLADIVVECSCPQNWNISHALIRQAGFSSQKKGVMMMADEFGSRCIVNGRIYPMAPGPILGGLQMSPDGVVVGGKKIEPLAGTDMPGASGGPDVVQIRVPANYTGSIKIGAASDSSVNMDAWNGGTMECFLGGKATLSAGKLKSLQKAVVDVKGSSTADITAVSTKILVVNVIGSGQITIKDGSSDLSNATVEGTGGITMKGNYRNLKQNAGQSGHINITN